MDFTFPINYKICFAFIKYLSIKYLIESRRASKVCHNKKESSYHQITMNMFMRWVENGRKLKIVKSIMTNRRIGVKDTA